MSVALYQHHTTSRTPADAQFTVRGSAHPSGESTGSRLDTFSVIDPVGYPGKPPKG
jgi:hypothetical protein